MMKPDAMPFDKIPVVVLPKAAFKDSITAYPAFLDCTGIDCGALDYQEMVEWLTQ